MPTEPPLLSKHGLDHWKLNDLRTGSFRPLNAASHRSFSVAVLALLSSCSASRHQLNASTQTTLNNLDIRSARIRCSSLCAVLRSSSSAFAVYVQVTIIVTLRCPFAVDGESTGREKSMTYLLIRQRTLVLPVFRQFLHHTERNSQR